MGWRLVGPINCSHKSHGLFIFPFSFINLDIHCGINLINIYKTARHA
jgi:hypothetical protein